MQTWPNGDFFFIFNLFKQILNLTQLFFFIFKSNTFAHAKICGAAKTRCRATCINAARSAMSGSDFHMKILAAPLSLTRQQYSAAPSGIVVQGTIL